MQHQINTTTELSRKQLVEENRPKPIDDHTLRIKQYKETDYKISHLDIEHILSTTLKFIPICTYKGFIFTRGF